MSAPGAASAIRVSADLAWVELEGRARIVERPVIVLDAETRAIVAIERDASPAQASADAAPGLRYDLGRSLLLPGLVNAHSHAFQRMIRGRPQRASEAGGPASFWSWRSAMYEAANSLDPAGVFRHTRACFAEMLRRGITCVGEFHYLHHQADGQPYADPNELSRQVIRAAEEVGLRLCLLEVYYARAGVGHDGPAPEQRRFCDPSTAAYLARVDALVELAVDRPALSVGIAPHSVRAVPGPALAALAEHANARGLPIHAHVSEQPRENQQCHDEHGCTPLELLARSGCMARPGAFTAVHAIHVDDGELALMAGQQVCACPTTEADLGDGIVPARRWHAAGVGLALGSDSNATIDLIQEARLLEMHERLRDQARLRLRDAAGRVAPVLLDAATRVGAAALGQPALGRLAVGSPFDMVAVDLDHPMLRDVASDHVLDALMLSGSAEPITQVWVDGRRRI